MNIENMKILRDHLAGLPAKRINMENYYGWIDGKWFTDEGSLKESPIFTSCGTCACIAGWAKAIFDPTNTGGAYEVAQQVLGLSDRNAMDLFTPDVSWHTLTKDHVLKVLDIAIATGGIINWDAVVGEDDE